MPDSTNPSATASNNPNDYNIEQFIFPPELAWVQSHQSYVVFYINVLEDSTTTAGGASPEPTVGEAPGFPGEVKNKAFLVNGKKYLRLKTAVALPIMEAPVSKYGADWDTVSLGAVAGWAMTTGTADGGGGFNDKFSQELQTHWGTGALDALKVGALSTINGLADKFGIGGDATAADLYSVIKRVAINEHRTQLFRSMRFREFEFQYKFEPANQAEANQLKRIINAFKVHMHPSATDGNLFLKYPAQFDIVFYYKNKENSGADAEAQNLFKISSCALTDFHVAYGTDQFTTFEDGMPTSIRMAMQFTELEQLTQERVQQGY
jgi:hypothetical protein